jgi:hypothetical protein
MMLIMSGNPRDVRSLRGPWFRLRLSKASKPTSLLCLPLSSNNQHDPQKMNESSDMGQSTKPDNSNQLYVTVRSDVNNRHSCT